MADVEWMAVKIINATWEKRNLGLSCQEVTISQDSTISQVSDLIKLDAEYQVVKSPIERPELIFFLQEIGFSFVEILYESSHSLFDPVLDSITNRYLPHLTCDQVDVKNIKSVIDNISIGMFQTDRVAIDPLFGVGYSCNRYKGWVNDEVNSGSEVFQLAYKNQAVGFFLLSGSSGVCLAKLGGIYQHSDLPGAGVLLNLHEIKIARDKGFSELKGWFSSNNLPVHRINQILGYKTRPIYNVFIRHFRS